MPSPIKRHPALQPLSRDHHFGLLLCWKIRKGLSKQIDIQRIKAYVYWFWNSHLSAHFEEEEKYVFPLLGDGNKLAEQALQEHRTIRSLMAKMEDLENVLQTLEETLTSHIRFEERELFNAIQEVATADELAIIENLHHQQIDENAWEDRFWE
ncbi:MAG TPA: cation-binding protein [Bacteroidetes bacterium]|nr:cation-binding protein [Bacteroidota bacterium]